MTWEKLPTSPDLCRVCLQRPATHDSLCDTCRPWHTDPPTWNTTTGRNTAMTDIDTSRRIPPGYYTLQDFTYNLLDLAAREHVGYDDEDDDPDAYWRAHEDAETRPLTKRELAHLCAEALEDLGLCDCVWCGVDTNMIGEYYMVDDAIWDRYGPRMGCLCIGCLEDRMGRRLRPADFKLLPDADLQSPSPLRKSERLQDRLGIGTCAL